MASAAKYWESLFASQVNLKERVRWKKINQKCAGATGAVAPLRESCTDTARVCENKAFISNTAITEWLECWVEKEITLG